MKGQEGSWWGIPVCSSIGSTPPIGLYHHHNMLKRHTLGASPKRHMFGPHLKVTCWGRTLHPFTPLKRHMLGPHPPPFPPIKTSHFGAAPSALSPIKTLQVGPHSTSSHRVMGSYDYGWGSHTARIRGGGGLWNGYMLGPHLKRHMLGPHLKRHMLGPHIKPHMLGPHPAPFPPPFEMGS